MGSCWGKPRLLGIEPSAQAVLHPSQPTKKLFYSSLRKDIWSLRGSARALRSVREVSQAGTYSTGGEEGEQPLLCHSLPSLSPFGCSSCCCLQQSFVASVSCFDSTRGKCLIILFPKCEPFHPKCPPVLLKSSKDGAHLATDSILANSRTAVGHFCFSGAQMYIISVFLF